MEGKHEILNDAAERGLKEVLEKAMENIQSSKMMKQVLQLIINYVIAELQAFAAQLDE